MKLTPKDYKHLISVRTERIRDAVWGDGRSYPVGHPAQPLEREDIPDFIGIMQSVDELKELIQDYENSIGPA